MGAVAFRMDEDNNLVAFAGYGSSGITVDGQRFDFADRPVGQIGWAPVPKNRQVDNGARLIVFCDTVASLRIPAKAYPDEINFYAEGAVLGQKGKPVASSRDGDYLAIEITEASASRTIFGVSP